MKSKLWAIQIAVILLFVTCFGLSELGIRGKLNKLPLIDHVSWYSTPVVFDKVFKKLRSVTTWFVDRKFKVRGPEQPKNKIVVVEIDSNAIIEYGRWPWHRDVTAKLIRKTFEAGAKVVGLDIMFSEPDVRMPDALAETLANDLHHPELVRKYETDKELANTIFEYAERLVLGWSSEAACQPLWQTPDECPLNDPDVKQNWDQTPFQERFAIKDAVIPKTFNTAKSPLVTMLTVLPNIKDFSDAAEHAGYFNAYPDPDSVVRRTSLFMLGFGKIYTPLAVEMARVGLKDDLEVKFTDDNLVDSVRFKKSGQILPITPVGAAEYNFRGPSNTFTYIPAIDVMSENDKVEDLMNRKIAGESKSALLKDAYVLIGLSALGAYDMRAFPFDSNTPGVEGHATLLDNILSNDMLIPGTTTSGWVLIFVLMIAGAAAFAQAMQKMDALHGFALFGGFVLAFGYFDFHVLFAKQHVNWDTSFLYLEFAMLFVLTVAFKYMEEQQDKKFVHNAFSKYVAPAIVDAIMKDRSKLSLGGERKELSILFSDIRGFTTFSEAMDAKDLSHFLNDYLGIMTRIVFAHKGTLDKYIGDAVMAFWGAPLDQPDHAVNACKAAVDMMKALAENRPRWKEQFKVDVNIGIGVNSGPVSVGNMGSDQNFEYTVIGDHVNLASRMEGSTKDYGIGALTSRFTFDCIKSSGFELPLYRFVDLAKMKGKKKAVEVFEVLVNPLNPEGEKLYNEGIEFYRAQKWDDAIAKFTQANELLARSKEQPDGPCEMYIERCKDFKIAPPPADWDGSFERTSK